MKNPKSKPTGAQMAALVQQIRQTFGISAAEARRIIGGETIDNRTWGDVARDARDNLKVLKKKKKV